MFQYILCFGSREATTTENEGATKFQYILCFGSSRSNNQYLLRYFLFQYILCFGSRWVCFSFLNLAKVSIHPMFRFKEIGRENYAKKTKFQYILCFGSSKSYVYQKFACWCFNTSYVSVQAFHLFKVSFNRISFNTSYVSVQG